MKRKTLISADSPQSPEAKRLVALVDKAATLTESKGKTAFPEFKKKGSEWLKRETYIFIADMNGLFLCIPPIRNSRQKASSTSRMRMEKLSCESS
jgi:hypothetical protein